MTAHAQTLRKYLELIGGNSALEKAASEIVQADSTERAQVNSSKDNLRSSVEELSRGREISPQQLSSVEALIIPQLRPVYDIVRGKFSTKNIDGTLTPGHALWAKLETDQRISKLITDKFSSIGRIEVPGSGYPYGGTGFVVGPNLLMTNRHVAEIFSRGIGYRELTFIPGRSAGIDFTRDPKVGSIYRVEKVRLIHPYWDMAVLEIRDLPTTASPLPLSIEDARDLAGQEIVVIGYPGFDPHRNPVDIQNDLFRERYQVKRLQPGLLHGAFETESFGKIVPAAGHDCSTLGGNSGSAIINLKSGEVVGLHFGGRYLESNYAVPIGALARDTRVVDLGINFTARPVGDPNDWSEWWKKADRSTIGRRESQSGSNSTTKSQPAILQKVAGEQRITIPIHVSISLGQVATESSFEVATSGIDLEEKAVAPGGAVVPRNLSDYDDRKGYDERFLGDGSKHDGNIVPFPTAVDAAVVAELRNGGHRLDYQNFSILMHAKRRLALMTASNITKDIMLRRPDPSKDYSRKGLFSERWFPDLRLEERFQIPEIFYTKDDGAFDKGHIVRRDDVAWGADFETLLKGNVDSFHVTNCSPQVAGYNRSDNGESNWGDLENHVLSEASSERLCVFAGPVLAENDETFVGQGSGGKVFRAKIPKKFWKVIVSRISGGLAAFGFVLEQDLLDVPLEFTVPEEFKAVMYRLQDISKLTGVKFDQSLLDVDQYGSIRGLEIASRAQVTARVIK